MTSPRANHRSSDGPTSNQRPVGFQLFRSSPEVGLYSVAFPGAFELWMRGYAACDWLRERPPSTHQPFFLPSALEDWDNLLESRGGIMVNGAPREFSESSQCTP